MVFIKIFTKAHCVQSVIRTNGPMIFYFEHVLITTLTVWGMPGQVALVSLYASGASLTVIFLAVALANMRMMLMVIFQLCADPHLPWRQFDTRQADHATSLRCIRRGTGERTGPPTPYTIRQGPKKARNHLPKTGTILGR